MLTVIVSGTESFDEATGKFLVVDGTTLELEHSLVSLSKWESIHEKAFLGKEAKTSEEVVSYIECMVLTSEIPPEVFQELSEANLTAINDYLNAQMTATSFMETPGAKNSREVVTSELIYYWMTVFSIPFECEHWHLNRLFTLIRICNIKQEKPKKQNRAQIAARNRELNEQRKKQHGTMG
jgi:hypothetical protein